MTGRFEGPTTRSSFDKSVYVVSSNFKLSVIYLVRSAVTRSRNSHYRLRERDVGRLVQEYRLAERQFGLVRNNVKSLQIPRLH